MTTAHCRPLQFQPRGLKSNAGSIRNCFFLPFWVVSSVRLLHMSGNKKKQWFWWTPGQMTSKGTRALIGVEPARPYFLAAAQFGVRGGPSWTTKTKTATTRTTNGRVTREAQSTLHVQTQANGTCCCEWDCPSNIEGIARKCMRSRSCTCNIVLSWGFQRRRWQRQGDP